mmetsp:Transcript_33106/g.104707  ORF Transcript_33106/g.104707 Transcript_33106/m.104707 type:complete len:258 (-) Transcript_33106:946-1719(-)
MHSLYAVRKHEMDAATPSEEDRFARTKLKNDILAKNYRIRERDRSQMQDFMSPIDRLDVDRDIIVHEPLKLHPSQHKFRSRDKRKELSHCNISPGKYIVERERIRMSSEFEKFDGVYYASVWDEHRGGKEVLLANSDRKPLKEIQPPMRFTPRTQAERIYNSLISNSPSTLKLSLSPPSSPLQNLRPSSQPSSPSHILSFSSTSPKRISTGSMSPTLVPRMIPLPTKPWQKRYVNQDQDLFRRKLGSPAASRQPRTS